MSQVGRNPNWIEQQEWIEVAKAICRYIDLDAGGGVDDHLVLSSNADTTSPGGLLEKLAAGAGISLEEYLDGAINRIRITNTAPDDHKVMVSGTDAITL